MPVRSGAQFVRALDELNPVVWVDGERVQGTLSKHPAFEGLIRSKAALYDLQCDPSRTERMTYVSPSTGARVGLSYLPPKTPEDLARRRAMSREWALAHGGWMGRAPDYMNTALMAFASAAPLFGERDARFGERLSAYYEHCRENDLSLAHTFIRPPVDRNNYDPEEAAALPSLSVVDRTAEGLVVDGARLMATQGGVTDELLVFPTFIPPAFAEEGYPLAFAFAIPSNTPGVSFIARAPFAPRAADSRLSARYDEIDTLVRFDRVVVPWDRVFADGDVELANRIYDDSGFYGHAMHQVLTRIVAKTEFFAGLLGRMTTMFELTGWAHVRDARTEAIATREHLEALQLASEARAKPNRWGVLEPATAPLYAAFRLYAQMYPRLVDAVQRIGASHLLANATEAQLASSELGGWLRRALAAPDGACDGAAKSRLFRLAWDASASGFAGRQSIYERYFFGDPQRLSDKLYEAVDTSEAEARLERFLRGWDAKDMV